MNKLKNLWKKLLNNKMQKKMNYIKFQKFKLQNNQKKNLNYLIKEF